MSIPNEPSKMMTSPSRKCSYCQQTLLTEGVFPLTIEEVAYFVANIQHEYLNKDTYYFARDLLNRMEKFLESPSK